MNKCALHFFNRNTPAQGGAASRRPTRCNAARPLANGSSNNSTLTASPPASSGSRRQPLPAQACVLPLYLFVVSVLSSLQPFSPSAFSAPSGGPYGPIPQTYTAPADAAHIYYVAPDGKSDAAGASLAQPTTLETAIAKAVTGDAIILRGGTYRTGGLTLNQGITLQPHADEQPILKGTRIADKWIAQRNGLWRTTWPREQLFPAKPADWWQRDREGRKTPLWLFNNDMVFIDGRPLKATDSESTIDANSYYIDYENSTVYIDTDPANRLVEITAHDSALIRTITDIHGKKSDRKGPTIRGITFTQYAFRAFEFEGGEPESPADPATYGKDIVGTTLEHVTITHCSRVAGYFRGGDNLTIRHCLISDTSTEGIFIIASSDCLLEKNIFARNNVEQITGYYPASVKIFNQSHRVTCRDNLVIDQPHSNGIWYDVGNNDAVFVDNWIQDCEDGFFFEISNRAICAGNVFVNCHKGVRALNSANVRVYQNTFVNTTASFERTERSAVADHFGWHPATGPDVDKREGHEFVGNLLVGDATFNRELLRFDQARALCGKLTKPQATRIDDNVYVRSPSTAFAAFPARTSAYAVTTAPGTLIVWSPAVGENCTVELSSAEALRQLHPAYETHSRVLTLSLGALFKSPEMFNFELIRDLTLPDANALPADVQKLLQMTTSQTPVPGAYQP